MKFHNDRMSKIFFPGNDRQACEAWYGIAIDRDCSIARANIVVVQSSDMDMGTSLWNTEAGRNNLLTRILDHDLNGVRVEFVKFFVALDMGDNVHCMEFPIHVDAQDFINKGNPHDLSTASAEDVRGKLMNFLGAGNKQISWWSGHVVGGCSKFFTVFDEGKDVAPDQVDELFKHIGYGRKSDGNPSET